MSSSTDLKRAVKQVNRWCHKLRHCPDCKVEIVDYYNMACKHEDDCGLKEDLEYLVKLVEEGDYY